MPEALGYSQPNIVESEPIKKQLFTVVHGETFGLFDIDRSPRQRQFGTSSYGYSMLVELGTLPLPLAIEGAYVMHKNEEPILVIQAVPEYDASMAFGYITSHNHRLQDRVIAALHYSTLTLTIPSRTKPVEITIEPVLAKGRKTFKFALDSRKEENLNSRRIIDNWRRIRARFNWEDFTEDPEELKYF